MVNERICDLRPVLEVKDEKELGELKKEVQKEIERIVGRYYFEKNKGDSLDMESFELAIRSSMHGIGRSMLEMSINADGGGYRELPVIKALAKILLTHIILLIYSHHETHSSQ